MQPIDTMPITQKSVVDACKYAQKNLYTDKRGRILHATPDESMQSVRIVWERSMDETYAADDFVEKIKACAAKFGDKVEF